MSGLRQEWSDASVWIHSVLATILIAVRPLIADGQSGLDEIIYQGLVLVGLLVLLIDGWSGIRTTIRFGWIGALAAVLALILLPAAWRSPLPAAGMVLWESILLGLALAFYLAQVLPERMRLGLAALLAGLFGEVIFASSQYVWALPDLARRQQNGDLAFLGLGGRDSADVAERIANGGIFGTFQLSNTFAAFLLLTLPLLFGAWRSSAKNAGRSFLVLLMIALSALVFIGSGSKGAFIAAILSAALIATWRLRGWNRCIPAIILGIGGVVAMVVPKIAHGLAESAHVRVGYWQGAAKLVGEAPLAGNGLRAFSVHYSRVLPIDAEPAHLVHNEILEAAVDGGVAAALVLAAFLFLSCCKSSLKPAPLIDERSKYESRAPWILLFAIPYFHVTGMLDLLSWPGGRSFGGSLFWSLVYGAVLASSMRALVLLSTPPTWALRFAFIAFALHCCIDHNLHSRSIVATLAIVSVLGADTIRSWQVKRAQWAIGSTFFIGAVVLYFPWAIRTYELNVANNLTFVAKAAWAADQTRSPSLDDAFGSLAFCLGLPNPGIGIAGDAAARNDLIAKARTRIHDYAIKSPWPDRDMELSSLSLWPPGKERLPLSTEAMEHVPASSFAHALLAEDYYAEADYDNAIAQLRETIRLAPSALSRRLQLAACLRKKAGKITTEERNALIDEADKIEKEVKELAAVVHYRNRP